MDSIAHGVAESRTRLSDFHFHFTSAWLPSLWKPSPPYLVSDLEPLSSFSGPTLMCEAAHFLCPTFGFWTGMSRKRWQAGEGEGREGAGKGKEEPCAASDSTETDQSM